jgi:nitrous oxidase accessory protein NosD
MPLRRHLARSFSRRVEDLEPRRLLAAHVVGDATVYATIQAAVDAASPGSVINVDAGVYPELVTVNKPLTLHGAEAGVDARDDNRGDPAEESIVRGENFGGGIRTSAFHITADGVTLDGFTVQDNTSSGTFGAGIVIGELVSGSSIVNNIIQNNVSGLFLANSSNSLQTVIRHNVFANNNNPGNNSGRGIYTDGGVSGGLLTNVLIDANTFIGNTGGPAASPDFQAAIGLEAQSAGKQFNITITNNEMRDNGKGVLAFNVVGLDIEHNFISGSTDLGSAALRFEGGNSNVTIERNTIIGNHGAAVRISNRFTGPDTDFTINQNNFVHNDEGGLTIESGGFAGHLDATDNYWGSSFGPGGDGPGFGDAITANDADVDFDPWAVAPVDDAPSLGQAPRTAGEDIADDLQDALDSSSGGDKDVRKKLGEIIDKLNSSLDGSLWDDNSHLLTKKGDKFFDAEKDAAHKLMDLIKNKKNFLSTRALGGILTRLTDVSRDVVDIALDDASGGDSKKLRDAQKELDKAEDELDRGHFDAAIDHLKNAWKKALEANK